LQALATKSPSAPGQVPERHVGKEPRVAARLVNGRRPEQDSSASSNGAPHRVAPPSRAPSPPASPAEAGTGLVAQPVDERIDRAVAERAHLLAIERKRIPRAIDGS
jgi:hypothetical protein